MESLILSQYSQPGVGGRGIHLEHCHLPLQGPPPPSTWGPPNKAPLSPPLQVTYQLWGDSQGLQRETNISAPRPPKTSPQPPLDSAA